MARHASLFSAHIGVLIVCGVLIACDSPTALERINPPELGVDALTEDAAPEDAGLVDGALDATGGASVTIDTTRISACDSPTVDIGIEAATRAVVTAIIDDVRGAPVELAPGRALTLSIGDLTEGPHTTAFDVNGLLLDGPDIHVDRTPPRVEWPVDADVCVVDLPSPIINDVSVFETQSEDGGSGCRAARFVRVVDACGFATSARSIWRVGPPGPPIVMGERALTWTPGDPCTTGITARLGRVGETPVAYVAGDIIEWPGDYRLILTAAGCNGPAVHEFSIQVPPGPCDRPTRPIDSAPNVRGWLEITSQRLVELSLELTARGLGDAARPVREAATLLARHPAFPGGCPPRDACLIDADWRLVFEALRRASAALVDVADTRAARRCLVEAARVAVAAGRHTPGACAEFAAASALVDAWQDDDARAQTVCLCSGECGPDAACVDAPVLRDSGDPIDFNRQIVDLGGAGILACLDDPGCAELPEFIERLRSALIEGDCAARGLLSVAALIIGRHCAGVGRFRHPGTDALAAAVGRWPLGQAGAATTVAHLDRAVALCLPP